MRCRKWGTTFSFFNHQDLIFPFSSSSHQ
jgi:hypothetical protein